MTLAEVGLDAAARVWVFLRQLGDGRVRGERRQVLAMN